MLMRSREQQGGLAALATRHVSYCSGLKREKRVKPLLMSPVVGIFAPCEIKHCDVSTSSLNVWSPG